MGTDPQGIVGQRRCFCLICWAGWAGRGQREAVQSHLRAAHGVVCPRRGLDWQAGSRWAAGKRPGGRPLKIECRRTAAETARAREGNAWRDAKHQG